MNDRDLARLVETSEATAYSNLMSAGSLDSCKKYGFHSETVGSATVVMADNIGTSLNLNRVIGLGIIEPATEQMLDEIDAVFDVSCVPYAIELSPAAKPQSIPDWLKARRIRGGLKTAMFFCDLSDVSIAQRVETDLTIKRVGPEYAEKVAEICCSNFGMPDAVAQLLAASANHAEWRHWVAFDGEVPVAAALSFVRGACGWLGWDATQPSHRGRRAQAALIAARLQDASDTGCQYVTAETEVGTSETPHPSYRNYQRMGFQVAYERRTYMAIRHGTATQST